jgi:hypothetical protein
VITAIEGKKLTVDAPIVCAIEAKWGGGRSRDMRTNSGSRTAASSAFARFRSTTSRLLKTATAEISSDEKHAEYMIRFDNLKNGWRGT